jgi:uncharacterized flavoprotein (TIGR03862 family)
MKTALVIGAGPAGLMAAEVLSTRGLKVIIAEAMPSAGRKFLMAGKSGLNLTKVGTAPVDTYSPLAPALATAVADFGPDQVMEWARGLGQEVFTGSTGRVFPVAMKASPLLRAWLHRLGAAGVELRTRWRWVGWDDAAVQFETPQGLQTLTPDVTVLALGGASWARLGSDGHWAGLLGGDVAPFQPANMGVTVEWSPHMAAQFGQPVKGVALIAGGQRERGEFIISAKGLEGGGIYAVSRSLRQGAPLTLDLTPDFTLADVTARLSRPQGKATLSTHLRKTLRIDGARLALLQEFGRPLTDNLGAKIKSLPIRHNGPRPMDEAISTAGGVRFDALDGLMLRSHPGTFVAGEMLDWEAPTGGYLITGCLATGRQAGMAAASYVAAADT